MAIVSNSKSAFKNQINFEINNMSEFNHTREEKDYGESLMSSSSH